MRSTIFIGRPRTYHFLDRQGACPPPVSGAGGDGAERLGDDRVRPRLRDHVVRPRAQPLELALVLADLALDLGDAEIDRAVHVLGDLVSRDREPVMQLEGDVDAMVVTLGTE